MKKLVLLVLSVSLVFVASSIMAHGQSTSSSSDLPGRTFVAPEAAAFGDSAPITPSARVPVRPLSRIAVGVGLSPLGIGFQVATNINRHFNIRGTGSVLSFTISDFDTNGFTAKPKVDLASAGASIDIYPFHSGLRLSPGVLFYNQNQASATFVVAAGTSFTLDNHLFYSGSGTNAVLGKGTFGLGNGSPAFTLTAGWGNMIPTYGGHWSFPVEVGVAFTNDPTVAVTLTGQVCDSKGLNCVDVATDVNAQTALAAQVKKYQDDFNPLKTYPIVSFGVAYNFKIR